MTEQTIQNLKAVREQMFSMLDNVKSVRGEKHACVVHALMNSSKCVEIFSVAIREMPHPEDVREAMLEAFLKGMHSILSSLQLAAGLSMDEMRTCIKDAEAFDGAMDKLLCSAVGTAMRGEGFGGTGV